MATEEKLNAWAEAQAIREDALRNLKKIDRDHRRAMDSIDISKAINVSKLPQSTQDIYTKSVSARLREPSQRTEAQAQLFASIASLGNTYLDKTWKLIGWALVAIFIVGPSIAVILSIFTVLPWWLWLGGMFLVILYLLDRRDQR